MEMVLLCLKIFFVRILDVSLGTVRTIVLVKGNKLLASLIGFIEVFVWFMIVREALNTDAGGFFIAFSYSLGFAVGTYIGGLISGKFIKGNVTVQVITDKKEISSKIREKGYAVTIIDVKGQDDTKAKYMLLIEISNTKLTHLQNLIKSLDTKAFLLVTETKYVQNGYFK